MKKISCLLSVSIILCLSASSQTNQKAVRKSWAPDRGYWVAEGNVKDPGHYTFYFYDDADQLLFTRRVDEGKIDLTDEATLRSLKHLLDSYITALKENDRQRNFLALVKLLDGPLLTP